MVGHAFSLWWARSATVPVPTPSPGPRPARAPGVRQVGTYFNLGNGRVRKLRLLDRQTPLSGIVRILRSLLRSADRFDRCCSPVRHPTVPGSLPGHMNIAHGDSSRPERNRLSRRISVRNSRLSS
ncbi:hypothetical protein GS540_18990 [Rhodococcus hoagii]|nr:hypothetical protein [Prescottella equi]